jgi:hypothetical protein
MLFNGYRVAHFKGADDSVSRLSTSGAMTAASRAHSAAIGLPIKGREDAKKPDKRNRAAERMRWKLDTPRGRAIYSRRIATVEPGAVAALHDGP